jgi:hypothetical protein
VGRSATANKQYFIFGRMILYFSVLPYRYRSRSAKKVAIYSEDFSVYFDDVFIHFKALFNQIFLFPTSMHTLLPT